MRLSYWCASGSILAAVALATAVHAAERPLAPAERAGVIKAIRQTLNDPGSAQFRWLPLVMRPGAREQMYCGLYNAKNQFGGYGRFRPFIVRLSPGQGATLVSIGDDPAREAFLARKSAGETRSWDNVLARMEALQDGSYYRKAQAELAKQEAEGWPSSYLDPVLGEDYAATACKRRYGYDLGRAE